MAQGMWVIFARIPLLIELHFAYGICDRLLVSYFQWLKCFHSGREGLHFFLWEILYSDFFSTSDVTLDLTEGKYLSFIGVTPLLQSPLQQEGITAGWEAALGHPDFTVDFILFRLWYIWRRRRSSISQRKHWVCWHQFFCCFRSAYISWVYCLSALLLHHVRWQRNQFSLFAFVASSQTWDCIYSVTSS